MKRLITMEMYCATLHGTCGSRVGSIMVHRDGQAIPTDPTLIGNIEHRCLSVLMFAMARKGMPYFASRGQDNCGLFCCSSFVSCSRKNVTCGVPLNRMVFLRLEARAESSEGED